MGDEELIDLDDVSFWVLPTCIVCLVSALILVTITFEFIHEEIIEKCPKEMKPMIDSLFGEMTILGFLSLVTFMFSSAGILTQISTLVFGEGEEESKRLQELLENIHFLIFFVMILFICLVLLLLRMGTKVVNEWHVMNGDVQNRSTLQRMREEYLNHEPKHNWWNFTRIGGEYHERFFMFLSLRKEFILARSSTPPFAPADKAKQLPEDFDYAEYLTIHLGIFLAHIIHLPPITWAALGILVLFFYVVALVIHSNPIAMCLLWLLFGVILLVLVMVVDSKCHTILSYLLNPADFPNPTLLARTTSGKPQKYQPLSLQDDTDEEEAMSKRTELSPLSASGPPSPSPPPLPAWTSVGITKTSFLTRWREPMNRVANRQLSLFWFDHMGPEVNMYLLRLHLLLCSIYISLLVTIFIPLVITELGIIAGVVYTGISGFLLWYEFTYILTNLIAKMSMIGCHGILRSNNTITDVMRKQKISRAIRAVMLVSLLSHDVMTAAKSPRKASTPHGQGKEQPHFQFSDSDNKFGNVRDTKSEAERRELTERGLAGMSDKEKDEILAVFDMYDHDGSGELDMSELGFVMQSLGIVEAHDEVALTQMFADLDEDNSGAVDRDEFLRWIARHKADSNPDPREMARKVFDIFDRDKSGCIMVSELITSLRGLKHGLSDDDLVQIALEMDEDGSGTITLEEFEAVVCPELENFNQHH